MSDTWWEPPLAGDEQSHLVGMLERLRATFRWKADALDATGLNTRVGSSTLTLGGLLKHLAVVEDNVFTRRFTGEPFGPPWDTVDWATVGPEWPLTSAADDEPAHLYALYDGAVARSRAALAAAIERGGLDQQAYIHDDDGNHASLRRLVCDLIEEYGRHTGHADLLREHVDGLVGEDPPAGWNPQ